jgi:hypothetical protein
VTAKAVKISAFAKALADEESVIIINLPDLVGK